MAIAVAGETVDQAPVAVTASGERVITSVVAITSSVRPFTSSPVTVTSSIAATRLAACGNARCMATQLGSRLRPVAGVSGAVISSNETVRSPPVAVCVSVRTANSGLVLMRNRDATCGLGGGGGKGLGYTR